MDDVLELPDAAPKPNQDPDADDGNSSGDEESADWTKLTSLNANRPSIPRRGEKEFEPAAGGGSGLQIHVLDRARNAMFDTLRATRSTSSKAISYGVWHPSIARVHVTLSRGIHFSSMGHSAPRLHESTGKITKRPELLPEEAIYLIERGALFCWKTGDEVIEQGSQPEDVMGSPMSVQQAYSEMIGTQDLTIERYQVYSYLKRLGYAVTRALAPTPHYPVTYPVLSKHKEPAESLLQRIGDVFRNLWRHTLARFNWWQPLCINPWIRSHMNYGHIYRTLKFIPSGHNVPPHTVPNLKTRTSPYQVFYHLYKPTTPFKKTSPPPPDFSVVVINARTTNMPSLYELDSLFDEMPQLPPPLPRQRQPLSALAPPSTPLFPPRLWFLHWPWTTNSPVTPVSRKPNPFAALKAGTKIVIIAAVDAGNISFFRFGQGGFDEWPMTQG